MQITVNQTVLVLVQGDITAIETDAIVNAANERLAHGGGVAGAIVRRGGSQIQQESDAWVREHGPVPTGQAAITGGGQLPARYVIHAVGPVYDSGRAALSAELLASAVRHSLEMADQHGVHSVALPAISTGIFGYPLQEAAEVMVEATVAYLEDETDLNRVVFCLYDQRAFDTFATVLSEVQETGAD